MWLMLIRHLQIVSNASDSLVHRTGGSERTIGQADIGHKDAWNHRRKAFVQVINLV
jgi:hypothetical protein